jgi:hypothetical protein
VAKAKGAGPIVAIGGSRVLGWTADPDDEKASVLYAVDTARPALIFAKRLPLALPAAIGSNQQEAWDFRLGPDGLVWSFINNVLVRIDPADGTIRPVGQLARGGPIAFASGRVYLGGGPALRRISSRIPHIQQ